MNTKCSPTFPPDPAPQRLRRLLLALLALAVLGAAAYWKTLSNEYVYDDKDYIQGVAAYQETLVLRDMFSPKYFEVYKERTYRPVGSLSFYLDSLLWNMQPRGAHSFNMLLHILVCWMALAVLYTMTSRLPESAIGAAIFAVHPIHVEAVALASNREELLCALFFFAALHLYLMWRNVRRDTPAFLILTTLCFVLALCSKEMGASLPAVLVLCDLVLPPAGDTRGAALRRGLPFYVATGALLAGFMVLRFTIMHQDAGAADYPGGSVWTALLTMSTVFFSYIKLMFAPWPLCADYVVSAAHGLTVWRAAALAGLAAYAAAAVHLCRRTPMAGFAMLFFAVAWLPVSNIIPFGEIMAERYVYIPSFALSALAACVLIRIKRHRTRALIAYSAAALAVLAMLAGAVVRCGVWRDDATLWNNTVACSPCSAKAHHDLGNVLARGGDFEKALKHYDLATRCDDEAEQFKLEYNRGLALMALGRNAEAEHAFLASINLHPYYVLPYYNLGKLAAQRGDLPRAERYFRQAIAVDPDNAHSYCVAGHHLRLFAGSEEQKREALKMLNQCVDKDPGNANWRAELALVLMDLGHRRSAVQELRTALSIEPDNDLILEIFKRLGVAPEPASRVDAPIYRPSPWKAWLFLALLFFGIIICLMYVYYLAME